MGLLAAAAVAIGPLDTYIKSYTYPRDTYIDPVVRRVVVCCLKNDVDVVEDLFPLLVTNAEMPSSWPIGLRAQVRGLVRVMDCGHLKKEDVIFMVRVLTRRF